MATHVLSSEQVDQNVVIAPNTVSYGLVMDSTQNAGVVVNKEDAVIPDTNTHMMLIVFVFFIFIIVSFGLLFAKQKGVISLRPAASSRLPLKPPKN